MGRRKPPPQPHLVYIEASGALCFKWDAPDANQHRFYEWLASSCEHDSLGELVSHRLGNIAGVGRLRQTLLNTRELFPVLLGKVIQDGTHCGDYLNLDEVEAAATEVAALRQVHAEGETEFLIRQFEQQMSELVVAALTIRKPIAF